VRLSNRQCSGLPAPALVKERGDLPSLPASHQPSALSTGEDQVSCLNRQGGASPSSSAACRSNRRRGSKIPRLVCLSNQRRGGNPPRCMPAIPFFAGRIIFPPCSLPSACVRSFETAVNMQVIGLIAVNQTRRSRKTRGHLSFNTGRETRSSCHILRRRVSSSLLRYVCHVVWVFFDAAGK